MWLRMDLGRRIRKVYSLHTHPCCFFLFSLLFTLLILKIFTLPLASTLTSLPFAGGGGGGGGDEEWQGGHGSGKEKNGRP